MKYKIVRKHPIWDQWYTEEGKVLLPTKRKGVFWTREGSLGSWEAVEAEAPEALLNEAVSKAKGLWF